MSILLLLNMQEKKNTEWKILIGLNMKTKRLLILKVVFFFWNLLSNMTMKRNLLRKQRMTELCSAVNIESKLF